MTTTKSKPTESTADREIVISREFDAPREMVWRAMTDPKQVVQWWGPRGFSTTIEQMDLRIGGTWKHVMRGPDGTNYPNQSTFQEIVENERIVYTHGGRREGGPGVTFVATWSFEALGANKTRLTIRQLFPSAEARNFVVKEFGAIEGGKQTLARLGEHLCGLADAAAMAASDQEFVISRVFDALRELVWKAWTEPEHMREWWGPQTFTTPVCEMDLRPGGVYHITMRSPDGADYPMKGFFCEVLKPERLVMTMDVSDHSTEWHDMVNPNRDKTKKPHLELLQTVTFEDFDGKTKLTIRSRFESKEIRNGMVKVGMTQGWSSSLDRLRELLPKMHGA